MQAVFYRSGDGSEPVDDFIGRLRLRELRGHYGNELYRILYRRSNNLFVLLHILRKNTS